MKCKDCKYWELISDYASVNSEVKKCKRMKMFWDCTDWDDDCEKRIFTDDSLAFVQDGSDYYAELLTKADFGCVMWEER